MSTTGNYDCGVKPSLTNDDAHKPLPVAGYKPQNQQRVNWVNQNKAFEEEALRQLDYFNGLPEIDQRWLAIGRTKLEEAWMAINRAIFQPGRISLPGDKTGTEQ